MVPWSVPWCIRTDGSVSSSGQRLFLTAENYHEVDGGAACHADFIINQRSAAEDLVRIIFTNSLSFQVSN